MKRILYDWFPAVLWAAVILTASSEALSAENTGAWLQEIARGLTGSTLSPPVFEMTHFVIRKLAHLTEYGIFGALVFRGARGGREGWAPRWAIGAVVAAAVLASVDEWHQTYVPGRTGAIADVFIDICGAAAAQLLARLR